MMRAKLSDPIGLLRTIYKRGIVTQAGLADEMNLSRSYVNSMVQRLRAADLLVRQSWLP